MARLGGPARNVQSVRVEFGDCALCCQVGGVLFPIQVISYEDTQVCGRPLDTQNHA